MTNCIFHNLSAQPLPLSVEKCLGLNITQLPEIVVGEEDFFYLYKVSYAWYTLIGFSLCCILAITVSALTNRFKLGIRDVDPDLFIHCVRKKLLSRQVGSLENQNCVKRQGNQKALTKTTYL